MVDSQELDMRLDAIDLLMLNLEDFSDYNQTYQDGEKEQEERRSRITQPLAVFSSGDDAMCVDDPLHPMIENAFQFDLHQLPCAANYFHSPSATPNNTPHTTPSITPESSNPGSPRGGYSGSSTPRSRCSPSAKIKPSDDQRKHKVPRHKRESHINAEYRRRNKIQNGFEEIGMLVPAIQESKHGKDSKSSMLSKTVEYCRQLRAENKDLDHEAAQLREEIEALTGHIKNCQSQLPVNGVRCKKPPEPIEMEKRYENYIQRETKKNWKFWIFSLIMHPLFDSYNQFVSTTNLQEFTNSVLYWAAEHCSLAITLRPAVFNTMRLLSTSTSILTSPENMEEEARKAASTYVHPRPEKSDGS